MSKPVITNLTGKRIYFSQRAQTLILTAIAVRKEIIQDNEESARQYSMPRAGGGLITWVESWHTLEILRKSVTANQDYWYAPCYLAWIYDEMDEALKQLDDEDPDREITRQMQAIEELLSEIETNFSPGREAHNTTIMAKFEITRIVTSWESTIVDADTLQDAVVIAKKLQQDPYDISTIWATGEVIYKNVETHPSDIKVLPEGKPLPSYWLLALDKNQTGK